ncbi:hypothetical protein OG758_08045 [Streptomyces sp. NBC_01474]|uniref:hypothetical protein n=1 Tax=Streptomyces TaxID=1883 RepID=UPI002DDBB069|nr:hypothetical protein [Streptomyces sp. NBC_01474]WSD94138.1 hypothetical protein OG758_08045 [Streptomyces sp. NBC_01474]
MLLLDFYLGGRSHPRRIAELYDRSRILDWGGFVAWAGGVAASVPFWQSTLYTGPFSVAFPGAGDLSMFVAAAAGTVLYLLTYRLKPLRQRTTGNPGQAPAQRPDRTTDLAEHT